MTNYNLDGEFKNLSQITCRVNSVFQNKIKKGDIITTILNDNTYIWDGEKVLDSYIGLNYRKTLPFTIEITDDNEFDPDSWNDVFEYNTCIWYSIEIRYRMKFVKCIQSECYESRVIIRGVNWTFICDDQTQTTESIRDALRTNHCYFIKHSNAYINVYISDMQFGDVQTPNMEIVNRCSQIQQDYLTLEIAKLQKMKS